MKRTGRERPRRMMSRADTTRLVSAAFFLVVLVMLIRSTGKPEMWKNWVPEHGQQHVGDVDTVPVVPLPTPATSHQPAADKLRETVSAAARTPLVHVGAPIAQTNPGQTAIANPAQPAPPAPETTGDSGADTTSISNGLKPGAAGNEPQRKLGVSTDVAGRGSPEGSGSAVSGESPSLGPVKTTSSTPKATGPTDQDPDEQEQAAEDFDFIDDAKAVGVEPEEARAYERIVRWVTNQPYELMVSRAKYKDPTYGEFVEDPASHRQLGKLFQLNLEIRKLAPFPDAFTFGFSDDDPHDPITLYEAWGSTEQAHGRLFSLVIVDPPKGMSLGNLLREKVHFVGYFFKLLAYEPARTLPGGKLLKAPILIGRFERLPPPIGVLIGSNDLGWAIALGGGLLLLVAIWAGSLLLNRNSHKLVLLASERTLPSTRTIENWLEHAEQGDLKPDEQLNPAQLVTDDPQVPHRSNGHSNGATRRLSDPQDEESGPAH